jgi:hypothetical protein
VKKIIGAVLVFAMLIGGFYAAGKSVETATGPIGGGKPVATGPIGGGKPVATGPIGGGSADL